MLTRSAQPPTQIAVGVCCRVYTFQSWLRFTYGEDNHNAIWQTGCKDQWLTDELRCSPPLMLEIHDLFSSDPKKRCVCAMTAGALEEDVSRSRVP